MKKIIIIIAAALVILPALFLSDFLDGPDQQKEGIFEARESAAVPAEVDSTGENASDPEPQEAGQPVSGRIMTVHFINVGQGDSTFIDFGDTEILIDAGSYDYGGRVSRYINQYVDGSLDYVIATHMDADHIGGLERILSDYQVGCIIDSGETEAETAAATAFIAAAKAEGCTYTGDYDTSISLGEGAFLDIIETGDGYSDSNDNSVVALVRYGNFKALFTGDMPSDVEAANLRSFSAVTILKVGHHGSGGATSQAFLDVIKPEAAIISAAAENTYGHPHADILNRLISNGIKVYGTYKGGTIVAETDGDTYSLSTDIQLSITDTCDVNVRDYIPAETRSLTPDPIESSSTEAAYIGNANSWKFHYPWCASVSKMAERNKVFFESREEAVSAGYKACQNCKP